jgi:hypothetical protein
MRAVSSWAGRLTLSFSLTLVMAGGLILTSVPPAFVVQQQKRAVSAYCAEWRKARGKLDADEMNRRILIRLERQYPTAFPDCRPSDGQKCRSWISALVEGLRRYGGRSLESVCRELSREPEMPQLK